MYDCGLEGASASAGRVRSEGRGGMDEEVLETPKEGMDGDGDGKGDEGGSMIL